MTMQERPVRLALIAIVLANALAVGYFGVQRTRLPAALELLPFLLLPGGYYWYYLDARQRGYQRSMSMGAAIVILCVLAIPLYLARSRPAGERLKAVGMFLMLISGHFLFGILGAVLASLVRHG